MRRAARLVVETDHLGCHRNTVLGHGIKALTDGFQFGGRPELAPHDIELATAGAPLRVDVVALAGHSDGSPAVVVQQPSVGSKEFRRKGIASIAPAQQLSWFGVAAVGVAPLYQESWGRFC